MCTSILWGLRNDKLGACPCVPGTGDPVPCAPTRIATAAGHVHEQGRASLKVFQQLPKHRSRGPYGAPSPFDPGLNATFRLPCAHCLTVDRPAP